ncbi:BTAD domain-containing putative transcriptional regulator [Streptomyces venezuelae ATCC 10712]
MVVEKFGLLGTLVVHDGTEPRPVTGPKVRVLLAALLLQANRTVSRDALKEALWGDAVPASADAALANHLTRLRRVLAGAGDGTEERLRTVAPGYQLDVHEGELDADAFEARVRAVRGAHRAEEWEAVRRETDLALGLWRGTPLADLAPFSETEAPALRVHQLTEARLQVLEWSFDAELGLGRHHEAVAPLTALAAEHPLREGFHRRLMLALHRSGRQAEAFSVFHRLRRDLVEELGTEPGSAVREAHAELLAGEPAPRPRAASVRPPFQLPCEADAFTGRTAEVAAVRALLGVRGEGTAETAPGGDGGAGGGGGSRTGSGTGSGTSGGVRAGTGPGPVGVGAIGGGGADGGPGGLASRTRAVVISGMGGVGKTALAVHVAHRVRDAFPDGALYADLRGYCVGGARTAHELLARFLSDLGVHQDTLPEDTDDRALLFRAALAERKVLLVLDNARNAAHVAPLLPAGGRAPPSSRAVSCSPTCPAPPRCRSPRCPSPTSTRCSPSSPDPPGCGASPRRWPTSWPPAEACRSPCTSSAAGWPPGPPGRSPCWRSGSPRTRAASTPSPWGTSTSGAPSP